MGGVWVQWRRRWNDVHVPVCRLCRGPPGVGGWVCAGTWPPLGPALQVIHVETGLYKPTKLPGQ